MWLVELANKIHLAEYHMLYFFIFLLCSGLYRMYDGRRRLLFEQQPDDRVNLIPDDDVVQLWHNLTKLNIKFGYFFQKYGLFLVVCAAVNILFFLKTNLSIKDIILDCGLFGFLILSIIIIIAFLGFLLLTRQSDINLSGIDDYRYWALNFIWDKESIIALYKFFHFYKREDWHKLSSLDEQQKLGIKLNNKYSEHNLFLGASYKKLFEQCKINREVHIIIGAMMKYFSWLLLIISITAYHGVKYYLINYV